MSPDTYRLYFKPVSTDWTADKLQLGMFWSRFLSADPDGLAYYNRDTDVSLFYSFPPFTSGPPAPENAVLALDIPMPSSSAIGQEAANQAHVMSDVGKLNIYDPQLDLTVGGGRGASLIAESFSKHARKAARQACVANPPTLPGAVLHDMFVWNFAWRLTQKLQSPLSVSQVFPLRHEGKIKTAMFWL